MDGGVHECARQNLRSFAFFPAERSMDIINEVSAELVHHGEKGTPVLKFVFKDLVPEVNRTRRANVEPKRCGPNLFLRTNLDSDLHNVVHEVAQFGGMLQRGVVRVVSSPLERQPWGSLWSSWAMERAVSRNCLGGSCGSLSGEEGDGKVGGFRCCWCRF